MQNMLPIGHRIYTLQIRQTGREIDSDDHVMIDYEIYPVVNHVREIRIGRALTESAFDEQYGPMSKHLTDITYLACPEDECTVYGEPFIFRNHVFSPCKNYLLGNEIIAGVRQRGYLSLSHLMPYAKMLQKAAKTTIPAARTVAISKEIPRNNESE